jgi:uncharacterized protein YutE (UPF0331/DUF86 family)
MLDTPLIQKKMTMLSDYVDRLEPLIVGATIKDIKGDNLKKDNLKLPAIERYFQLAVDVMIDINTHIIREKNFGTVDDLQSTFKLLGDCAVLDHDFAYKIAPIVGARNMLVHRYEKLDTDMFLKNLQDNFPDFKKYLIEINHFLKREK